MNTTTTTTTTTDDNKNNNNNNKNNNNENTNEYPEVGKPEYRTWIRPPENVLRTGKSQ